MTIERLLITSAASWYIAYALTNTSGPFAIFERLREKLPLGGLTTCIICSMFWIALLIGFLQGLTVIESIAAAGVGLWIHSYSGWRLNL